MWKGWQEVGVPTAEKIQRATEKRASAGETKLGAAARQESRKRRRDSMRLRLTEELKMSRPELYNGERDIALSDEHVEMLREAVCEGLMGQELRDAHNLLVKGLYRGTQELGWQLNPPSMVRTLSMEASAISNRSQDLCQEYNVLNAQFFEDLGDTTSQTGLQKDISLAAGQLLFSLIMHSGCLSNKVVLQLPEAIRSGAHVQGDRVWLECRYRSSKAGTVESETDSEQEDSGTQAPLKYEVEAERPDRRVFPVPVTALLLMRFYKRYGRQWPRESVRNLIGNYLKHLDPTATLGRSPQKRVIELSRAKTAVLLPGVLRTYAETARLAPPISSVNMVRFVSGGHWRLMEKQEQEADGIRAVEHERIANKAGCRNLRESLSRLKALLRAQGVSGKQEAMRVRAGVRDYLNEHIDLHPLIELLAHWAIHLLAHGNKSGEPLAPSSTLDYVEKVSKALLPLASELVCPKELKERTGEQWEALYEVALENSSAAKPPVAARLGYFHRFLEQAFDYSEAEIEGTAGAGEVDAAIITPTEYIRAYELLAQGRADDLSRLCAAALVLGYRCGLRRTEALGLKLKDFVGFDTNLERVELLVQRNGFRRLKSFSATRRLPLWVLLTKEELILIRSLRERRKAQCSGDLEKPMFDLPVGIERHLVERMVMVPVTQTLRHVTGDQSARFHHLRHSFASLTLLRMLEFEPLQFIPPAYRIDMVHLYHPCADEVMWRKAGLSDTLSSIYMLSTWLGHSSPSITMQTYAHSADWALVQRLSDNHEVALTQIMQSNITGMSLGATEKHNQRRRIRKPTVSIILNSLISSWPRDYSCKPAAKLRSEPATDFSPYHDYTQKIHYLAPYQVERFLTEKSDVRNLEDQDYSRVAKIMGFSEYLISKIHNNAVYLATLTYKGRERAKGQERSRFFTTDERTSKPFEDKDRKKGDPQLPFFIAPPRKQVIRRYTKRFFDALIAWYASDSDMASKAISEHLHAVQRVKSQVRHRKEPQKLNQIALFKAIGIQSWIRIEVRVPADLAITDQKLKRHYSQWLKLEAKWISVERVVNREGRYDGLYGSWFPEVQPPEELIFDRGGKWGPTEHFWEAILFAAFSAATYLLEPDQLGSASTPSDDRQKALDAAVTNPKGI